MTKALISAEMSNGQSDNTKTPPKTSITRRLRPDLGRSVGLTTATKLVWLTGLRAQPSDSAEVGMLYGPSLPTPRKWEYFPGATFPLSHFLYTATGRSNNLTNETPGNNAVGEEETATFVEAEAGESTALRIVCCTDVPIWARVFLVFSSLDGSNVLIENKRKQ